MPKKIISHRGNLDWHDCSQENNPDYIDKALAAGFDAMIDFWVNEDGSLFLGLGGFEYPITVAWLAERSDKLWVKCRNLAAAVMIQSIDAPALNYFWQEKDTMTLTSKGYWWVDYYTEPIKNSVAFRPEIRANWALDCHAICTNYPALWRLHYIDDDNDA